MQHTSGICDLLHRDWSSLVSYPPGDRTAGITHTHALTYTHPTKEKSLNKRELTADTGIKRYVTLHNIQRCNNLCVPSTICSLSLFSFFCLKIAVSILLKSCHPLKPGKHPFYAPSHRSTTPEAYQKYLRRCETFATRDSSTQAKCIRLLQIMVTNNNILPLLSKPHL